MSLKYTRVCEFGGVERQTGTVEWTTGVEYWNGAVESSGSIIFLYHGTINRCCLHMNSDFLTATW